MGGGVSAAVSRALGADRQDDANALVIHAIVIALVMAALFSLTFILGGPWLYRTMGARGDVLQAAVTYSFVIFAGGVFVWTTNILMNVVRGTGAMMVAASVVVINEIVHVACAPVLILGFGNIPSLGVAGAGIGVIASYAVGTLVLDRLPGIASRGRLVCTQQIRMAPVPRHPRRRRFIVGQYPAEPGTLHRARRARGIVRRRGARGLWRGRAAGDDADAAGVHGRRGQRDDGRRQHGRGAKRPGDPRRLGSGCHWRCNRRGGWPARRSACAAMDGVLHR